MLRHLLLWVLCGLVTACATPHFDSNLSHPDWEISGKIGVRESAIRATSSMFQWRQQNDNYAIFLFNSLGQIQLTITGNGKKAMAQEPNGNTTRAATPEALLEKLTGWYFPISASRYWLQGQTQGGEVNQQRSSEGFLSQFTSDPWQVGLSNYKAVGGIFLPHKIYLEQDKLSITLIVKQHAHFIP